MANITKESHQHNSNLIKKVTDQEEYDEEDTLSLTDLPIEKNDDSAADRNQTRSSQKIHDMFEFSSPNNQQKRVTNPTRFAAKSPQNIRYLVTQASPAHHTMLSTSSSPAHHTMLSTSSSPAHHTMLSTRSSPAHHTMLPTSSSPAHHAMLSTSSSPAHHTMLSKSPGKRSVKKSGEYVFQKSKSTSLYHSRSKKSTKGGIEHEYEEHKVSVFSSPLKSKWLFVLLGLPPKIPTDAVELKTDIKNRQSRHAPSTFFPINVGGGGVEEVVPEDSPRPKASEKRKKSMLGSCFGSAGPVQI